MSWIKPSVVKEASAAQVDQEKLISLETFPFFQKLQQMLLPG